MLDWKVKRRKERQGKVIARKIQEQVKTLSGVER